ncbi:Hypothetical protein SCF082_LOCUS6269 [Durusdinium trenchii]|uniref:Uncharacterized protein n=1 Tax=Durusdinium trenchii TaxID=1381693 RepID=A0ABP0IBE6_9DINO
MNFRELTMLAYVNMPEDFGDHAVGRANGGRLRCYVATKRGDLRGDTAQQLQDLEPLGGRAVIFRSKDLLHEAKKGRTLQTFEGGSACRLPGSLRFEGSSRIR